MAISAQHWLVAFVVALALHLLAGALIWGFEITQSPRPSPRGVMVSLDTLAAGNSPAPANRPEPVTPIQPTPAAAAPSTAPRQPAGVKPAPAEAVPTIPAPAAPQPVTPTRPDNIDAIAKPDDVRIPVAETVTVEAADSAEGIEMVQAAPVEPSKAQPAKPPDDRRPAVHVSTRAYIANIRGMLGQHKYYPPAARRRGVQGTVRLYMVIDRSGRVVSVSVARSSGSTVLDQAAITMIKRAAPLPAMPDGLLRTRLEIILPVRFTLGARQR